MEKFNSEKLLLKIVTASGNTTSLPLIGSKVIPERASEKTIWNWKGTSDPGPYARSNSDCVWLEAVNYKSILKINAAFVMTQTSHDVVEVFTHTSVHPCCCSAVQTHCRCDQSQEQIVQQ